MPKIAALGGLSSRGFGEFTQQTAGAYIEDVFSTYLYTGTGNPQTITNGIDLSTKGGLVWLKYRSGTPATGYEGHYLFDTVRGNNTTLSTNSTAAVVSGWSSWFNFLTTGFDTGTSTNQQYFNKLDIPYASWTFRKQPKFFDVITYTGDGTNNRLIAHSLGSVPGMVIVKCTSAAAAWPVWHNSLGGSNYNMYLNTTGVNGAQGDFSSTGSASFSSTSFPVSNGGLANTSGQTYVAYLFAHNAGGFGADGSQNVISCGSFNSGATGAGSVTLGYEPQFILRKSSSSGDSWIMSDTMRGMALTYVAWLNPNDSAAEQSSSTPYLAPTSTGFSFTGYPANTDYIYMAIRRGPMKTPTDATKVFSPQTAAINTITNTIVSSGAAGPIDFVINKTRSVTGSPIAQARLTGGRYLLTDSTAAEVNSTYTTWDLMTGTKPVPWSDGASAAVWQFKRAPSFFDIVCYTGTGVARTVNHNLGAVPEFIIVKKLSAADNWPTYFSSLGTGASSGMRFNTIDSASYGNTTRFYQTPTSSLFYVGTDTDINASGATFVAYLFASCPGVSKIGTYTGTGATQTISCGFTGGARYVLIKRTDSTGSWWVWDTARGMVAGTDPRLAYNSTAAETNANWVYTTTGGFQIVTSDATVNANGGSYIYLAIA